MVGTEVRHYILGENGVKLWGLVGARGIEPRTFAMSLRRSDQLSYAPRNRAAQFLKACPCECKARPYNTANGNN